MRPSRTAGSRCRKRRTVVKFTVSGGRDRAARPPFEDPRASSTVPRRFRKGPQRRSFWDQDIGQFWYTFWVTFGLLSGPPPARRQYSRSTPGGVLFGTLRENPVRAFWQAKTCNCRQVYCSTVSESGAKAGPFGRHLSGGLGTSGAMRGPPPRTYPRGVDWI